MYIYNITFVVSQVAHNQWVSWMKNTYFPETNLLEEVRFYQVISTDELTFAVHHQTKTKEELLNFVNKKLPELQKKLVETFGDSVLIFGTELNLLNINSL